MKGKFFSKTPMLTGLLWLLTPLVISAQVTVTGVVTDEETGESLPGVTIIVKGSTTGAVSDNDGSYTVEAPPGSVLVFSFVGYESKEVPVDDRTHIDVTLMQEVTRLDEIIVIGYGTSSRKLLTSSVADVSGEELEGTPRAGIEGALQGRAAGVQINQNSGTPGAAPTIRVRGITSIFGSSTPLYVVDGIPIITGNYGQIGFEGQGINATANLDPSNIESISVLKDASAAAIYGARGANGVVLITTKTGKANQSRIDFKTYHGWQKEWKRLEMLNADQWKEYVSSFDPDFVDGLDPSIDTDWQEEVFRVAPISHYELSASGGNEDTRMYISGSYFDQEGIVIGSDYRKFSGRINLDHQLTKRLALSARIGSNYSINNRIVGDQTINGVLPNAISKPPVYAVKDELGNYLEEGFWDNPVAIGNEVTNEARSFRNLSSIELKYNFLDNLVLNHQWGFDFYQLHETRYEPTTVDRGAESNGIAVDARSEVMKITQNTTLNYRQSLGDHKFDLLLGYSFEMFRDRYNDIRGVNFPNDNLRYLVSAGTIEDASSNARDERTQSFFGRLVYNYRNKILSDVSIRRDGSTKFGDNNKYALFPAISLAWRISEESFLQNASRLDELKLKISYGLTGNDNIGDFRYMNLYSSGYNYMGQPGIIPSQIPNPDLKWETTSNFNAGVDIGVLNSRVNLSVEYYYNLTTDLLLPRPIPGSSGFSSVWANVGSLYNRGFEFMLNTVNVDRSFRWTTDLNLSFNRNRVLELYNDQPFTDEGRGNNAVIVDEPVGIFYMYESLGVDPSTGDLVFSDLNENDEVDDGDRTIVGDPNPEVTGGFTNLFTYGGFDLRIFFQFSYGNDIFNGTRQYAEAMKFGTSDNQLVTIMDRWQERGDITYVPRHDGTYNLFPLSSHYIEDGSYLRLKELTFGYNFPAQWLTRSGFITQARIYFRGQNLLTFTNYSGMDPEVHYGGPGNISQGTDFFTFPQPRAYMFGINISF
jgi:TonB-linked SusC/RagA family outer membrane protein